MLGWRRVRAMALPGEAEFLQGFAVHLQGDRLGLGDQAHALRPVQIIAVGHLVVTAGEWHLGAPETAVFDVAFELFGVWRALAVLAALAAPAGEQADPRRAAERAVGTGCVRSRRSR